VSTQFGEACQEISANPQEVFSLLLFQFLLTTPEMRGSKFRALKKQFNDFAESVDFKALEAEINTKVEEADLFMTDWLQKEWDTQETEI
jgi:hypothetical protein